MPIPYALLEIQIAAIMNADFSAWNGRKVESTDLFYVVADVNGRFMGRSAPLSQVEPFINLTQDPDTATWQHYLRLPAGGRVAITVQVVRDSAKEGPAVIHTLQHVLIAPSDGVAGQGNVDWLASGKQFITAGDLRFSVIVTLVPQPPPVDVSLNLNRSVPTSDTGNVNDQVPVLDVRIARVRGLHQPRLVRGAVTPLPALPPDASGARLSQVVDGYKSEDDRGRIFINQRLDGSWAAGVQMIELTAVVVSTALPLKGAEVRWTVAVPDDPSDDAIDVHRAAGALLDPRDYDEDHRRLGTRADGKDDNNGASPTPPWMQCDSFAIRQGTNGEAFTVAQPLDALIDGSMAGETRILLACPDEGGDRLIVKATLAEAPKGAVVCPDETGIMTMWKRVKVDYYRMAAEPSPAYQNVPVVAALALPVQRIARHFEPAFVQLEIGDEIAIPVQHARRHMASDHDQLTNLAAAYCADVFKNAGAPGYFCLIAAKEAYPKGAAATELYNDKCTVGRGADKENVIVPGDMKDAQEVRVKVSSGMITFKVAQAEGKDPTLLWLVGLDMQDAFTGQDADGSRAHAYKHRRRYFPRGCHDGSAWLTDHPGYGAKEEVTAVVRSGSGSMTRGTSPFLTVQSDEFFAGRTLIFTHHSSYSQGADTELKAAAGADDAMEKTIVHELTHAFGMPHKCGKYTYLSPRPGTCTMNYERMWITEEFSTKLIARSGGQTTADLCARHLIAVRRVHLEKNGGLGWK